MKEADVVETSSGRIKGARREGLLSFRGVPYADAARFGPPQRPLAWAGVRDATERGPIAPQNPSRLAFVTGAQPARFPQSEDCLVVSVQTPSLEGRRPVLVWFHGGAYLSGGGELPWYDGQKLALEGDVVVVSVTYRLGVFGYLWSEEPQRRNLGLQDQLAALRWVKLNIEQFGGDPQAVTAFGQSAGADSIVAMIGQDPSSRPFRRAIVQSAPLAAFLSEQDAMRFADLFRRNLGADPLTADVEQLLAAQKAALVQQGGALPLGPVMERGGRLAGRKGLDLLIGWTMDDAGPFAALNGQQVDMRKGTAILVEAMTAGLFAGPSQAFARAGAEAGATFLYSIDWRPQGSPFGATHCVDLPLLLGDEAAWTGAPLLGEQPWADVERFGKRLRAAWTAFARSGDPATPEGWDWAVSRNGTEDEITHIV